MNKGRQIGQPRLAVPRVVCRTDELSAILMFRDAGRKENSLSISTRMALVQHGLCTYPNQNEIQTHTFSGGRQGGNNSEPSVSSPTNREGGMPTPQSPPPIFSSIPNFFTSNPLDEKFYHCGERTTERERERGETSF